jgi:hypothetical protein
VAEPPAQIVGAEGETLTVGFGFTVTVTDVVPVQPNDEPVTVYVVVDPGLTFCVAFKPRLWLHEYESAPEAVIVAEPPGQIDGAAGETLTVGFGLTVIVILAVFVHPFAPVPVTTYVVVARGVTFLLEPAPKLWLQEYALPPLAVIVTCAPWQIVVGDAEREIDGEGKTVTVIGTLALGQPPSTDSTQIVVFEVTLVNVYEVPEPSKVPPVWSVYQFIVPDPLALRIILAP